MYANSMHYFTVKEIADNFGMSERAVRKVIDAMPNFPAKTIGKHRTIIPQTEFFRWAKWHQPDKLPFFKGERLRFDPETVKALEMYCMSRWTRAELS